MYNGIGLDTPRGSGTNGYVQRNLSTVRKTKEKVPDYQGKEDSAVRPFDPELVEHERRRQAEVRCMELRELLEEQELPDDEIEEKVNAFRAKLLAEKKLAYQRDASGRAMVKDSHEYSVAQEQKNDRAKDAFGITASFVPGSSLEGKNMSKDNADSKEAVEAVEASAKVTASPVPPPKSSEKAKKRKKSHKRSKRSSSESGDSSSSEEEERSHRKKRKKEKKKKSKKSHRHRHSHERKANSRDKKSSKSRSTKLASEKIEREEKATSDHSNHSYASNHSKRDKSSLLPPNNSNGNKDGSLSEPEETLEAKYSLSILDFGGHHKYYPSLSSKSGKGCAQSSSEVLKRVCLPILASVTDIETPIVDTNGNHELKSMHCNHERSRSRSSDSNYSRSHSGTAGRNSISGSRSPSKSPAHSVSISHSDRTSRSSSRSRSRSTEKSRSQSASIHSHSRSRSRSHSRSTSVSASSHSRSSVSSSAKSRSRSRSRSSVSRSPSPCKSERSRSPSIPRRRGSPSFMERRRITSARKRPIPYKRKDAVEWEVSSDSSNSEG